MTLQTPTTGIERPADRILVALDTTDADDVPAAWTELRARIRDARPGLPPGAQDPIVYDDFGDTYGIFYAVTAEGYSDERIRDIARMLRSASPVPSWRGARRTAPPRQGRGPAVRCGRRR